MHRHAAFRTSLAFDRRLLKAHVQASFLVAGLDSLFDWRNVKVLSQDSLALEILELLNNSKSSFDAALLVHYAVGLLGLAALSLVLSCQFGQSLLVDHYFL